MRHYKSEAKRKLLAGLQPATNESNFEPLPREVRSILNERRGRCILTLAFLGNAARYEDAFPLEPYSNEDAQSNENPAVLATMSAAPRFFPFLTTIRSSLNSARSQEFTGQFGYATR
jgi:hypothetical protein